MIFGKLSLGGNLIVQLCIFTCKDNAMLGYNVACNVFKNHRNFFVSIKKICEKISHLAVHISVRGGGGHEKCAPSPLFSYFLTLP